MPGHFSCFDIFLLITVPIVVIANIILSCCIGIILPKHMKEMGWYYIGDLGEMSDEVKRLFCSCKGEVVKEEEIPSATQKVTVKPIQATTKITEKPTTIFVSSKETQVPTSPESPHKKIGNELETTTVTVMMKFITEMPDFKTTTPFKTTKKEINKFISTTTEASNKRKTPSTENIRNKTTTVSTATTPTEKSTKKEDKKFSSTTTEALNKRKTPSTENITNETTTESTATTSTEKSTESIITSTKERYKSSTQTTLKIENTTIKKTVNSGFSSKIEI